MHSGELLTRGTVWVALTSYVASEAFSAVQRDDEKVTISWGLKAAGCVFFLAHIAAVFNYFYSWHHAAAYADTARQSKELTGWNSGDGLYLNYLLALVWVSEVIWPRITAVGYLSRSIWWTWTVRVFFLFMIFNGAFVFVRSNVRWFGLFLCLFLLLCWWLRLKRSIDGRPSPKSS